ncbi:hypothetical protein FHG87_002774 [Trinorchestia longiramus]|nr:hypothetical protein FHG87_002774 [Trinorchestia longiramus]
MPSVSTSKRKRGEKENHPKPTDSYLYAKLLGDLDADIENLELQLSRLEAEVLKYGSAIDRSLLKLQSNVSKRPVRPGMIRAALLGCQQHLLDDAFQFLSRQRITSKKHHWDMVSSKFPIMLAKCGLSVWGVLKMLFRLPSKCTVTKYKGRARRNPSVFNNSVFTNIFLRKEKTTRFYRARKRNLGKLKTSKSSVSDSLRDFLGEKSNMDASN